MVIVFLFYFFYFDERQLKLYMAERLIYLRPFIVKPKNYKIYQKILN